MFYNFMTGRSVGLFTPVSPQTRDALCYDVMAMTSLVGARNFFSNIIIL